MKKLFAEFFGTFWLVFGGCGTAIFGTTYPGFEIGHVGVALAFGLSLLSMAFAVGPVSGAHFNPAVTVGFWSCGYFNAKESLSYILVQVIGGVVAAAFLFLIVSGRSDFDSIGRFAANGYDELSPGGYSLVSVLITEFITTAFFVIIILGCTTHKASRKFAPIAAGLALTLIHLISIPISNTSVNPARSTGQVFFAEGGNYTGQLWLFWLAPITGAIVAGLVCKLSKKA
jgi:aquaporin Z